MLNFKINFGFFHFPLICGKYNYVDLTAYLKNKLLWQFFFGVNRFKRRRLLMGFKKDLNILFPLREWHQVNPLKEPERRLELNLKYVKRVLSSFFST